MKPPINTSPLWQATRDMHHACEHHAVGAAMATGKPPLIWYAAWLQAMRQIHEVVDRSLDPALHRVHKLAVDILACEVSVPEIAAAKQYVQSLTTGPALAGAGYVLTGAHLMGGEIMRRRLQGLPTEHLTWDDRAQALVRRRRVYQ